MHIKISPKALPTAIALAAGFSFASNTPTQANGFAADTKNLPNASSIYHTPLKIQIVDTSPQVTDTRHPQENTVYQINIPPMPQGTTNVVQIGGPVQAPGNGAGNPNTVTIRQNSLPFAGPTSNITPHQPMANQLPKGSSTQGWNGTLAGKPKQSPTTATAQSAPMAKPLASTRPPATAVYNPIPPSSGVSQGSSTKTKVIGSLLHPEKAK